VALGHKIQMDTDYLTPMAYDCIRLANDAADILKSELGAACSQFRTEDDYLHGIMEYVKAIRDDPQGYLDRWDLLEEADVVEFRNSIQVLHDHIAKTIKTPVSERGEPEFKR
jgi:hypothetical protein